MQEKIEMDFLVRGSFKSMLEEEEDGVSLWKAWASKSFQCAGAN